MSARGILKFLVLRQLVGKTSQLKALYDYLYGLSPSECADKYDMDKTTVRTVVTRFYERVRNTAMSRIVAENITKIAIPIIISTIPNKIKCTDDLMCRCLICGRAMWADAIIEDHICKKHPEELDNYVEQVIQRIRETAGVNNRGRGEAVAKPSL